MGLLLFKTVRSVESLMAQEKHSNAPTNQSLAPTYQETQQRRIDYPDFRKQYQSNAQYRYNTTFQVVVDDKQRQLFSLNIKIL